MTTFKRLLSFAIILTTITVTLTYALTDNPFLVLLIVVLLGVLLFNELRKE